MPRRSRLHPHVLRKQNEPRSPARPRQYRERERGLEDARTEPPPSSEPSILPTASNEEAVTESRVVTQVSPAAAPYIRRRPVAAAGAPASARPAQSSRAERLSHTDYGYVVTELRRIALIGGGIVILLLVLSRLVH